MNNVPETIDDDEQEIRRRTARSSWTVAAFALAVGVVAVLLLVGFIYLVLLIAAGADTS